jgi:alpha-1,3-rhamnosyl/mannosyltransferase
MRALLPPSMRGAETILASTQAVISRVTAYVKKEKRPPLHTVAFGVDEIFLQDPPAAFDAVELPVDAEPYVLFVGTLEPKKGLHSLLTAYASLRGQVNLVLAGQTGWDCGSVLQAIHDYDGPGRIIRLGYVPRSDLPRLYARAAVTVMPSLVEGFGLPVLESMAMNTPVVYSNCEALREVAGDYGFPYVAGEPGPLAECIEDALDEGIADGAQAYARSFTWPRWAEKVNERLDLFPDHG